MDADIQFGDIEETAPEVQLRPDCNRHYAVVAYEEPDETDLPIFVDLDVLHDMESHAQTDTSVELGGVLLGGQYLDDQGRTFVVITDSLRAEHYEATKGSFKFTHDTWSEISRQREEFPPELQMVGWYHTHPDWGVFLSGMDMFICDNFFNKKLDVALVIDPCRGDRGMFMWTGNPSERVRRTGGFYVMASRFREQELALYTACLAGGVPMPADSRSGFPSPAPVVHIHESRAQPWMVLSVMGLLTVQFCLVALIAWKMIPSPSAPLSEKEQEIAEKREEQIDALVAGSLASSRADAQQEVLNAIVAQIEGGGPGLASQLEQREIEIARLKEIEQAYMDAQKQQKQDLREVLLLKKKNEAEAKAEQEKLKKRGDSWHTSWQTVKDKSDKQTEEIAELTKRLKKYEPEGSGETSLWGMSPLVVGLIGIITVLLVGCGVLAAMIIRKKEPLEKPAGPPEELDSFHSSTEGDANEPQTDIKPEE